MQTWFVYIVKCSDDTLYTGVTTDLARRVTEHNSQAGGARYTRSRKPVELVYSEKCDSRSMACTRESRIKRLSRLQKLQLFLPPENEAHVS